MALFFWSIERSLNMDEMKIRTSFTKHIVSKILNNIIRKKTGCNADLSIRDVSLENADGITNIHLDICVSVSNSDLKKFLHSKGII